MGVQTLTLIQAARQRSKLVRIDARPPSASHSHCREIPAAVSLEFLPLSDFWVFFDADVKFQPSAQLALEERDVFYHWSSQCLVLDSEKVKRKKLNGKRKCPVTDVSKDHKKMKEIRITIPLMRCMHLRPYPDEK